MKLALPARRLAAVALGAAALAVLPATAALADPSEAGSPSGMPQMTAMMDSGMAEQMAAMPPARMHAQMVSRSPEMARMHAQMVSRNPEMARMHAQMVSDRADGE